MSTRMNRIGHLSSYVDHVNVYGMSVRAKPYGFRRQRGTRFESCDGMHAPVGLN